MALSHEEISRLIRIRQTLMQMLQDSGYFVTETEVQMGEAEFLQKYGENMKREDPTISKIKRNDNSDQIYVFFPDELKVGVKTVNAYVDRMRSNNVKQAILVVQQRLTPFAKSCVGEAELLVNIKNHDLVPEHQLLIAPLRRRPCLRDTL